MSRQISPRYLLFYLSVSAILVCGSSRRIPRGASCPSCSQDCPEALTVQLPWNPHQESNLHDFSFRNSPYSRLIGEEISQNVARNENIPLNQNSMFFGNNGRFAQEPTSQNFFSKSYLNNSPKFLDRREIFSQDKPETLKPARGYSLGVPSRQTFDRSENLFLRSPRDKHTKSLSEDKVTKDYEKTEEHPTKNVLVVYRADRDTKLSWKNSRDTSNDQSERSSPKVENIYRFHQEDILDEERNANKKPSNFANQLRHPQERYNPIEFGASEVKRIPYIKDTNVPESTKEVFDNWDVARDSPQSSKLEQLGSNILKIHPAKKPEIIYIAKNDNERINSNSNNSKFLQGLSTWSRKDEESLDSLMKTNTRRFEKKDDEDMKEYFEDETEHFMNDEDMKEYFEDETEQDAIGTERDDYNPRILPQNIWKGVENEELFDDLDFMRENSQETEQSGLYYEKNNKYFQDEQNKDVIFQDEAHTNAEAAHAPIINAYNAYILPRYLNIVNDNNKYPVRSKTQELLEARNNIRMNTMKGMDQRFFEDEADVENNTRIQDFLLPKDIFDVEEYSLIADKRNNVRNKNEAPEALTELDPDLLDDIENPQIETTEATPK